MGLAGIEVYDILRDEFSIQIEFGDIGNVLAIISVGDRELEIERLLGALSEIQRRFSRDPMNMLDREYRSAGGAISQQTFHAKKRSVPIRESLGMISAELVMAYPPDIDTCAQERLTSEIIDYIRYAKEKGCVMTGTKDMEMNNIETVEE